MLYQWQDKKPTYQAPFTGWVADSAEIIGDVHLADNVSVWFGAVIRADNAPIYLGKNSNVQENSVIHTVLMLKSKLMNCYTVKDSPQPHSPFLFGLLNSKPSFKPFFT